MLSTNAISNENITLECNLSLKSYIADYTSNIRNHKQLPNLQEKLLIQLNLTPHRMHYKAAVESNLLNRKLSNKYNPESGWWETIIVDENRIHLSFEPTDKGYDETHDAFAIKVSRLSGKVNHFAYHETKDHIDRHRYKTVKYSLNNDDSFCKAINKAF